MIELLEFTGARGYLLLLIGGAGAASALAALGLALLTRAFRPALLLAGVTLGLGCTTMLMGLIGRTQDLKGSLRAVAHAHPDDRESILEASRREAQANLTLGAYVSVPLVLLALGAMGLSFARTGESA